MYVVTAEQMRELDRRAIEAGIPGVVLMENAGRAVFEVLRDKLGGVEGKRIVVVCGAGNNGGDGFVVARHLYLAGANVDVIFVGDEAKLTPDARLYYELFQKADKDGIYSLDEWRENYSDEPIDAVVDAIFGTGLKNALSLEYKDAIGFCSRAHFVVSVDIPSGVIADTGEIPSQAVRADVTVTFGYPKLGQFLFPAAEYVGELYTNAIGWNWEYNQSKPSVQWFLLPQMMPEIAARQRSSNFADAVALPRIFLEKRRAESNKGDYGHVGIIAGSQGMAGAPALAARAAQRSGTGLVTVLAPACVQQTIAAKLDEQMTIPLPNTDDGTFGEEAFDKIAKWSDKASVLCLGPGMTTEPPVVALVHRLIAEIDKPLVLDADGLNALAQNPDIIAKRSFPVITSPLILTPHPGEAARLLGTTINEIQSDRIKAVRDLAQKYQAFVVLKGRHSLIADFQGNVIINTTGNPGMATGGAGDTLTGIIGGFLARYFAIKTSTPHATHTLGTVALAVLIHGYAGDLAAAETGESGLIASDIANHLPAALKRLETPCQ
jgi:ADP-dependent NAD(P)H-hydrate dehydratase / NAD(P)H-hydrate epimerase